jgi:hypothetical protein
MLLESGKGKLSLSDEAVAVLIPYRNSVADELGRERGGDEATNRDEKRSEHTAKF